MSFSVFFSSFPYIASSVCSNDEVSKLLNLRAQTVCGYPACFSSVFEGNMMCQLGCVGETDSLQHILQCLAVIGNPTVQFVDVYGDIYCQKRAVSTFSNKRSRIIEKLSGIPGLYLDT